MSLLPPGLLQGLSRSRLAHQSALPSHGVGDRRSRATGLGMEFADHRLYQPGDDIRHLDRHAYDRLKQHVVRQYSVYQPLPVTVLIDASASMGFGGPPKLPRASQLAGLLSYVGLTGNDQVQVGAHSSGTTRWFPRLQGAQRAAQLFAWLETLKAGGESSLPLLARSSMPRLVPRGMLILISDFLSDGIGEALALWGSVRQEIVGVQILSPEETDPELLSAGPTTLVDGESGFGADVTMDEEGYAEYRRVLRSWQAELEAVFAANEARLFITRSDDDLERSLVREWRTRRLIF